MRRFKSVRCNEKWNCTLCVDHRKLNTRINRDQNPISLIDEFFRTIREATNFWTRGAVCGYWQTNIEKLSSDMSTFTSHQGLYRFLRMSFELWNSPKNVSAYNRCDSRNFKFYFYVFNLYYVFILFMSRNKHIHCIRENSILLNNAGKTIKPEKCQFFTETIDYLVLISRKRH